VPLWHDRLRKTKVPLDGYTEALVSKEAPAQMQEEMEKSQAMGAVQHTWVPRRHS